MRGSREPAGSAARGPERPPSAPGPDPWGSQRARARRPGWARGSRTPPGAAGQPGHRGPAEHGVAAERTCAGGHAPLRSLVPERSRPDLAAPRRSPRSRQDGAAGPGSARSPAPPASPAPLAAAAAAPAGARQGRGPGALPRRLHLRRGLAGLRRARAGGAARGPARLDAEPVSAALPASRALSLGLGPREASPGGGGGAGPVVCV